jgi:CBS domain-containing protein
MQAQDIMIRGVISVGPDMPVQIAARTMVSYRISAVTVLSANSVVFTDEGLRQSEASFRKSSQSDAKHEARYS